MYYPIKEVAMKIRLLMIMSALLFVYPAMAMTYTHVELDQIEFTKQQETKRQHAAQKSADKKVAAQCSRLFRINKEDAQAVKETLPLVWKFRGMPLEKGVLQTIFSFLK